MSRSLRRLCAGLLLTLTVPAWAQVFVSPRLPGKSRVRYYDFDWKHIDILVGPEADTREADAVPEKLETGDEALGKERTPEHRTAPIVPPGMPLEPPEAKGSPDPVALQPAAPLIEVPTEPVPEPPGKVPLPRPEPDELARDLAERAGGVRLYFYQSEREVAERAAGHIAHAYRYLVRTFRYVPNRTFPYVLYSSYEEFLQTNLFPLTEGTLGVTSTEGDLRLTLPYFGDHRLFEDVGTHEMAHQFTIQKVRTFAERADSRGDPLQGLPLWFIEGLAEFYAKRGLDDEAAMLVRDLFINPDVMKGYAPLDFFSEGPLNFLWIYKVGQARCAFLEETYGEGFIQKVLEASPRVMGRGGFFAPANSRAFEQLLEELTGDSPRTLAEKFQTWMKRRAFGSYLEARQDPLPELLDQNEEPVFEAADALSSSPDGDLLLVRTMDPLTGNSSLHLLDRRSPERAVQVARGGLPGTESLHPVFGRNFDIVESALVFAAKSKGRDVLYLVPVERKLSNLRLSTEEGAGFIDPDAGWEVDIALGKRRGFPVGERGIIAVYSPSLSPDGKRIAFIGLDAGGTRDVYLLTPKEEGRYTVDRLTEDVWAERALTWGPQGIVFNSDATSHGRFNLFAVDPDTKERTRLTTEARDHLDPEALANGRLLFTAYDEGSANVHELEGDHLVRRTDVPTGLFDVSAGPDGSLWSLVHRSGRRRVVRLPANRMLAVEGEPQPDAEPPRRLPAQSLVNAEDYRSLSPKNWQLGQTFALFGGGYGGFAGQLFTSATDRLQNHALLLNLSVYGSFKLLDGALLYINQEKRLTWAVGPFQNLRFRYDQTLPEAPFRFTSGERFYGASGTLRWPFDPFSFIEGTVGVGGAEYFLLPAEELLLLDPARNGVGDLYTPWQAANRGARFQTELALRLGYDTLLYHPFAGPLSGGAVLLEGTVGVQPFAKQAFGSLRLDAARYFQIVGQVHLMLRGGVGTALGGDYAQQFYLLSLQTLRGVEFSGTEWLVGRQFLFTTAELQLPLNDLIQVALLNNIEAILGVDFGGVGDVPAEVWNRRVLDFVVGANLGLGPFVFQLHFAKPIGIGSPYGVPSRSWVTNFGIGIAGLEGLLGAKTEDRRGEPWRPAVSGGWQMNMVR